MFLLSVITFVSGAMENSQEHRRDYLVWDATPVKEYDMQYLAEEKVQTNYPDGVQPLRTTLNEVETTNLIYECDNCSTLLTVENLQKMYEVEKKFFELEDYSKFCKAASSTDSSCDSSGWSSFVKNNFESTISTLTQAQIDAKLVDISANSAVYYQNNYFFDESFSQSNTISKKMRSIFLFANPIEYDGRRYKTFNEDERDQESAFIEFSKKARSELINMPANFEIKFYNKRWYEGVIDDLTLKDVRLLAASFAAVFIYVAFHLQSAFLASVAMLGIALSLPVAVFINRFIFQVTIFNFINYISIFVILGIAADDVFVFTDCWKQSATFSQLKEEGDTKIDWLRKRMNYTWRRTSKAILTTSLTTCMSFLATGFSKLLPISAFGFFSAMFVMMLYVFTITIYPCCIILFDKYLVNRCKYCPYIRYLLLCKCCCHRSKDSEKENEDASENDSEQFESPVKKVPYISRPNADNPSGHSVRQSDGYDTKPKTKGSSNNPSENNKEEEDHDGGEDSQNPNNISRRISHEIENEIDKGRKETKANDDEPEIEELTPIEKFFRNYWNSWMNKFKFLIFAVTIIWVSFAIWRVTRFKTAKNPIQRLESDHPLEVLDHMVQNDFHSALNTGKIEVSFVWGLEGLDKKGVGRWDPTNLGKLIYDDTFNLAPEANQQRLLDICADLRNQDLVENRVVT